MSNISNLTTKDSAIPCVHSSLSFIGIQETTIKHRPLLFFNCLDCDTTITYSIEKFLGLLFSFKREDSKQLILSL